MRRGGEADRAAPQDRYSLRRGLGHGSTPILLESSK
jgi:hypothetical protein